MNTTYFLIQIEKKYITAFVGYYYHNRIFTLDFLQKDIDYDIETEDGNFSDKTLETINEMTQTLKESLKYDDNLSLDEFYLVTQPENIYVAQHKGTYFPRNGRMRPNDYLKLREQILDEFSYPDQKNICVDNVKYLLDDGTIIDQYMEGVTTSQIDYLATVYRCDTIFYDKCAKMAERLGLNLLGILPTCIGENYIVRSITSQNEYNILDLNSDNIFLTSMRDNRITKIVRLNYGFDDLTSILSEKYYISKNHVNFILDHYGYSSNLLFPVSVSENITLQDLSMDISAFMEKVISDLEERVQINKNTFYLFGPNSNFIGLDILLSKLGYDNFVKMQINVLGARNISAYPLLGAVLYYDKIASLRKRNAILD